jgi:hypothetical protein
MSLCAVLSLVAILTFVLAKHMCSQGSSGGPRLNDACLPYHKKYYCTYNLVAIPCFIEVTMLAAWELWKVRNDKVFHRRDPNFARWLGNFKSQCLLQSCRFKADLRSSFCVWLDAFS